jgi:hypothetical protein
MKRLIPLLAFSLVLATGAFAQKESDKESLRGIAGMFVLVEDIDLDAQKDGLVRGQIQDSVEKHIRAAGIQILSLKTMFESQAQPYLYVNINASKSADGTYVYNVSVTFRQMAILATAQDRKPRSVITWETSAIGMVERRRMSNEIRSAINSRLDAFIKDFRSANTQ